MVINNPTTSTSYALSSTSAVTATNAKPLIDKAVVSQAQQPSSVVKLSTQGQMMSMSDRPGSMGESIESSSKESSESASVQFQEGESVGRAAASIPKAASSSITAYTQMAAR